MVKLASVYTPILKLGSIWRSQESFSEVRQVVLLVGENVSANLALISHFRPIFSSPSLIRNL